MKKFVKIRIPLIVFLILFINQLFSYPPLIVNLSEAKNVIKEYYLSGRYSLELDSIIADAIRQLGEITISKNSTFVFDVDETALSNFEYEIIYDFGYIKSEWNKWVESEKAVPIRQVKAFYDTLLARKIKVVFITGRNQSQYQATLNNLKKAGYVQFDTLICRGPNEQDMTAREFKTLKRKELTEKGYKIIGSIGDQWSDLEGGYTILKIKIPNYMYKVE